MNGHCPRKLVSLYQYEDELRLKFGSEKDLIHQTKSILQLPTRRYKIN